MGMNERNPDWFGYVLVTAILLGPLAYLLGSIQGGDAEIERGREIWRRADMPDVCRRRMSEALDDINAEQADRAEHADSYD
jgi:hypothetical protein